MILLIDNYDSFSYNLYQAIGVIEPKIRVVRNDALDIAGIKALNPSHILLSPGPGYPREAGICMEVARTFGETTPILGVCLGHQAICAAFGATIRHAKMLMHGKQSEVHLQEGCPLFQGIGPNPVKVGRYHSLAAGRETLPECFEIMAESDDGEIMAVSHREYPLYGLQFHPESILTPAGPRIIENFLKLKGAGKYD